MYSKTKTIATLLALLCAGACRSVPWRDEPVANEVNLAFTLEKNLVVLQSVTVDARAGRFLFGSATPRTLLDPKRRRLEGPHVLQLSDKLSIPFTPDSVDLRGIADGIVGGDLWSSGAVTIDYAAGLVTYQKEGMHRELMTVFPYSDVPAVQLSVDGRTITAIVDTTSPDTLTLPGNRGRTNVRVTLAGTDFGAIDVGHADVATARIGNRLLSRFLITIDYAGKRVGMWRDPRVPR